MEEKKQPVEISTENLFGVVEMERLYYEMKARLNIITFMIQHKMNHDDIYDQQWEEYLAYVKAYNEFQQIFAQKNNLKQYGNSWTLDFYNKKVIIEE